MFLFLIFFILAIVFFSTRYGFKSKSKPVRILSYAGVFLSVMTLVLLAFDFINRRQGQ